MARAKNTKYPALAFLFMLSCNAHSDCSSLKEGSTAWMACLSSQSAKRTGEEVQSTIESLKSKINKYPNPETGNALLEKSQETWKIYLKEQCDLEQHLFGGIESISYTRCSERMTKEREEVLNRLLGK